MPVFWFPAAAAGEPPADLHLVAAGALVGAEELEGAAGAIVQHNSGFAPGELVALLYARFVIILAPVAVLKEGSCIPSGADGDESFNSFRFIVADAAAARALKLAGLHYLDVGKVIGEQAAPAHAETKEIGAVTQLFFLGHYAHSLHVLAAAAGIAGGEGRARRGHGSCQRACGDSCEKGKRSQEDTHWNTSRRFE